MAYLDYAREEFRNLTNNRMLTGALSLLIALSRPLMHKTGLDHQVQPNNWLLSTNIWPGLGIDDISTITQDLLARWPDRAIVWRSLNEHADHDALDVFRTLGYRLIPARQVYLFDCRTEPPRQHANEKRDSQLLRRSGLTYVAPGDILPGDFGQIETLYRNLYIDKYTELNPQYSSAFLKRLHEGGIIQHHGLRRADGVLCGVIGFYDRGDVMTAPVVGYDTGMGQEAGLYRQLMAIGFERARDRHMLFNISAGAASFKRLRGAVATIEYTAVYVDHLPRAARLATELVRRILVHVGLPIMKRFEL